MRYDNAVLVTTIAKLIHAEVAGNATGIIELQKVEEGDQAREWIELRLTV